MYTKVTKTTQHAIHMKTEQFYLAQLNLPYAFMLFSSEGGHGLLHVTNYLREMDCVARKQTKHTIIIICVRAHAVHVFSLKYQTGGRHILYSGISPKPVVTVTMIIAQWCSLCVDSIELFSLSLLFFIHEACACMGGGGGGEGGSTCNRD